MVVNATAWEAKKAGDRVRSAERYRRLTETRYTVDSQCRHRPRNRSPKPCLRHCSCGNDKEPRAIRCASCARQATRVAPKSCLGCGVVFKKKGKAQQKYCSLACSVAHRPAAVRKVSPLYFRVCSNCEQVFATKWVKKLTCSSRCQKRVAYTLRSSRRYYTPKGLTARTCIQCGMEFAKPWARMFCSRQCKNDYKAIEEMLIQGTVLELTDVDKAVVEVARLLRELNKGVNRKWQHRQDSVMATSSASMN